MKPECDCKYARHTHGDNVMYAIHKCRCTTCREARSAMERERRKAKLYGRHYLTDAEPARKHLRALSAAGMGWKRVAKAAGVSPSSVCSILYGRGGDDPRPPRKQISKALEAKLLAVTPALAQWSNIDNLGSVRRLQALAAAGWSQNRLAAMLDMNQSNFGVIIHGERDSIRLSTAKKIEALFDEHWGKEPPAASRFERAGITRAKREAAAKGWVTAAAWDDIDDPSEEPKAHLTDSIPARSRRTVEKIDRLELLARDGYGDNDDTFIKAGWGSRNSGYSALRRVGREELLEQLQRNDTSRLIAS